jgi:hypothetical protein
MPQTKGIRMTAFPCVIIAIAIAVVSSFNDMCSVRALVERLARRDWPTRNETLDTQRIGYELTKIPNAELWILALLKSDRLPCSRSSLAFSLRFVGTKRSVTFLVDLLRTERPEVQMEAAATLGALRASEAVPVLLLAAREGDINVRANACIALGRLGGMRAAYCLQQAVLDPSPFVRECAAIALSECQNGPLNK